MLRDGHRVLYFMNEEPASQVLKRLVQRITNKPHDFIKRQLREAVAESHDLMKNLFIKELAPGTFKEIYSMTNVVKPDVVVIDQLRNIRTRDDNRVTALEAMAMEARALGKTHNCIVVSVTQAGDSARNKLVLDDGDIDFSNTGIPATADLIIGIGANQEYINSGKRMITIVKNKLGPEHTSFPVQIDPGLSKILGFK
jgi:KaiC/GvpD/RAD55 family RecA-like ATPase